MYDLEKLAIAHVRKNKCGKWVLHRLDDHLFKVAKLAAEKAQMFNSADWAEVAGLWHDLGKYRPNKILIQTDSNKLVLLLFNGILRGKNGRYIRQMSIKIGSSIERCV